MDKKAQTLIIGLWILVILTMLALSIGHSVSMSLRLNAYQKNKLKAICLAKAKMNKAIVELENDTNNYDALNESWAEEAKFGIVDEERKININTAPKGLLVKFLERMGVGSALDIANNICAWRGDTGVTIPDYTELGYSNKGNKFTNKEKLTLVKDIDEDIYGRLEDSITVFGNDKVNINTVSPENLEILVEYCIKELENRGVTERNPEDLIYRIIDLRQTSIVFTSASDLEESLGDLSSHAGPRNILNELYQLIGFESSCFYIVSSGKINGNLAVTVTCIFDRSNKKIIYWHEG